MLKRKKTVIENADRFLFNVFIRYLWIVSKFLLTSRDFWKI